MKKIICLVLALTFLLSGCLSTSPNNTDKEKVVLAASFYPVYIFLLNVTAGIEEFEICSLAEQNEGCLHDYTLTAADAKILSKAEILVINGAGMEGFTLKAAQSNPDLKIVDSSAGVDLLCHEEQGEESHDDSHSNNHESNSHIWLSVSNAKIQIKNIKNALSQIYPQYSETFEKNYSDYIERLEILEEERDGLSREIKGKEAISFNGAYAYLASETGLVITHTVESDDGAEPSGKALAELTEEIKRNSIKALFTQPDYEGSSADILSAETGARIYVLNPVTKGDKTLTAYEDIMSENYQTILKAVK